MQIATTSDIDPTLQVSQTHYYAARHLANNERLKPSPRQITGLSQLRSCIELPRGTAGETPHDKLTATVTSHSASIGSESQPWGLEGLPGGRAGPQVSSPAGNLTFLRRFKYRAANPFKDDTAHNRCDPVPVRDLSPQPIPV
jgi:hypothetical protein